MDLNMKCAITGSKRFIKIFKLSKFPIFMGVKNNKERIERENLVFFINKDSGSVQINPKVKLNKLYKKSHGYGTAGKVWKQHHEFFFNFIKKKLNGKILEIGAGNNSIAQKLNNFSKIEALYSIGKNIIQKKKNKKIIVINDFFSDQIIKKKLDFKINIVVHSHFFEHVYDPNKFLRQVHNILSDNGYQCFSIPNMPQMLKSYQANAVNFEHPFYYDKEMIKKILLTNGFKIVVTKNFLKNHSIMYITKKINSFKKQKYSKFQTNKKIFSKLYQSWINDKSKIQNYQKNKKNIFFFGAHIFSQVILHLIKDKKNIIGVLDNDKDKIDKFLYGFNLKVFSPRVLLKYSNPYVYMRVGAYSKEIKKQILSINKATKFI